MATRGMEVMLQVGEFDADGGAGMIIIIIQAYIDVQKVDLEEGVPYEVNRITAMEIFKSLGEGVGLKEEDVNKLQPEAGLNLFRKE